MSEKVFELVITADSNDADYVTNTSHISEENLERIKPILKAIKDFKPYTVKELDGTSQTHRYNWPRSEYAPRTDLGEKYPHEIYPQFSLEDIEFFEEYLPFGEYGIHTIVSAYVYPIPNKTRLL